MLPDITYGAEILTLTKAETKNIRIAYRKMEKLGLVIKLSDRVTNLERRNRTKIQDIIEITTKLKWLFASQVARMKNDRWTRRNLQWMPRMDKRSRGIPPARWAVDPK